MNKLTRAALRAISHPNISIKKDYKLRRKLRAATGRPPLSFYRTWDHQVDCGDHEIPVRLFSPRPNAPVEALLLFLHGGGWVTGNIDTYDRVCHHMAQLTGRMVVSVDYRLAPEHRFPAGLEDCYTIARALYRDAALLGIPPKRITLIGDSAGANLAAALSLLARDRGEFLPSGQILIYPVVYNDHSPASPFASVHRNGADYLLTTRQICEYMELYRSCEADLHNPYFAPLLAEDLTNQPRTLVLTAEFDPLRDEGEAYAKALAAAGNPVECHRITDAIHGYFSLPPHFRTVRESYGYINAFLQEGDGL